MSNFHYQKHVKVSINYKNSNASSFFNTIKKGCIQRTTVASSDLFCMLELILQFPLNKRFISNKNTLRVVQRKQQKLYAHVVASSKILHHMCSRNKRYCEVNFFQFATTDRLNYYGQFYGWGCFDVPINKVLVKHVLLRTTTF